MHMRLLAAITKSHRRCGLNNRNLLPQLWGLQVQSRMLAGLVLAENCQGNIYFTASGSLTIFWLIDGVFHVFP